MVFTVKTGVVKLNAVARILPPVATEYQRRVLLLIPGVPLSVAVLPEQVETPEAVGAPGFTVTVTVERVPSHRVVEL